jgi:hypothetical protein
VTIPKQLPNPELNRQYDFIHRRSPYHAGNNPGIVHEQGEAGNFISDGVVRNDCTQGEAGSAREIPIRCKAGKVFALSEMPGMGMFFFRALPGTIARMVMLGLFKLRVMLEMFRLRVIVLRML